MAVLRRLQHTTPLSPAAVQVYNLAGNGIDLRRLAAAVNTDPPLAAQVLRLANTPLFGVRYGVTSILQAVAVLGVDRIRAITTTAAMRLLVSPQLHCPALKRCWRHSVACGWISQELSSGAAMDGNFAYIAGLLHDLGRYAIFGGWTAEYSSLLDRDVAEQCLNEESARFGVNHAEVGAFLLEHWGFPKAIVDVASRHHEPIVETGADILQLVATSCHVANSAGYSVFPVNGNRTETCAEDLPNSPDFYFRLADGINQIESM